MKRPVTENRIVRGLERLGLGVGDTVMVHSSLSSFGYVTGGAPTVVRALLRVLGEKGTLVAPTFSRFLIGETFWDRENTPSLMGAISEAVRTWPGALRSNHAAHPIAAIGPHAPMLCRRPHRTGFGPDSPFKTMVEMDARILLLGVNYSCCTMFHMLEAENRVPYRFLEARPATVVIDGQRNENACAWEHTRKEGVKNDFMTFGRLLEAHGFVRQARVGSAHLRRFNARELYKLGMAEMEKDILFLVAKS